MTSSIETVISCIDSDSPRWQSRGFLEKLIELDSNYFPNPWSPQSWQDLMEVNENYFLVSASQNDQIVGFALFKLSPLEELAHLLKIMVIADKRRERLGAAILQESLESLERRQVSKFYLEVEVTNLPAITLYEHFGFAEIHQISNFYGQSKDALIMVRE